jgi:hypothetical protein
MHAQNAFFDDMLKHLWSNYNVCITHFDMLHCTQLTHNKQVYDGHVLEGATATGYTPSGNMITDYDSTEQSLAATPAIKVLKTGSYVYKTGKAGDDSISFTFTITNKGVVPVSSLTLTDAAISGAPKCGTDLTPISSYTIQPGASISCTASATVSSADFAAGTYHNSVQVCGQYNSMSTCSTDAVDTTVPQNPKISIDKTGYLPYDDGVPGQYSAVNCPIQYTFNVSNIGNVPVKDIAVLDAHTGTVDCKGQTTLAVDASMLCTGIHHLTQAEVRRCYSCIVFYSTVVETYYNVTCALFENHGLSTY